MVKIGKKYENESSATTLSVAEIFTCMSEDFGYVLVENTQKNHEYDFPIANLSTIHNFVEKVLSSSETGFEIEKSVSNQIAKIRPTRLSYFYRFMFYRHATYPRYFQASELVRLFYRVVGKREFLLEEYDKEHLPSYQAKDPDHPERPEKIGADVYNELINALRTASTNSEFRKPVQVRAQAAGKNFDSAVSYVDQLFSKHKSLQIVRLDCSVPAVNGDEATVKFAKECLKKFANNKRNNRLYSSMAGFLWKLEYHPSHGYFFHFMFFFLTDGWDQTPDLARKVGDYWNMRITAGNGEYRNCKESKNKYVSSSIGVINGRDPKARDDLNRALYYMTAKDQYLVVGIYGNGKRFGRGAG